MEHTSLAELTERSQDAAETVRRIIEEIERRLVDQQKHIKNNGQTGMTSFQHQALGEGIALKRLKEWILSEDPRLK